MAILSKRYSWYISVVSSHYLEDAYQHLLDILHAPGFETKNLTKSVATLKDMDNWDLVSVSPKVVHAPTVQT